MPQTNKYSKWLKIDLHIHTDWSMKTKENDYKGSFSVDELYKKLNENNVDIFSLTDHNIINLPAYEEYYDKHNSISDPLLLIGVELDIECEINGSNRIYHSLIIFSQPTKEKAKSVNDKLEKFYSLTGIQDLKQRKLTFENLVDILPDEEFFFIPHANSGDRSIVESYKGQIIDAQKMVLLMPSALEKVKPEAIRIYKKGFNNLSSPEFKDRDDIAYINFSDNHNINQYPCKHKSLTESGKHEFHYIKGTKSYETLRLASIDPKSRIKSPEEYKSIEPPITFITGLQIKDLSLIKDSEIIFSPELNVIIGGRSSGKSLLLNLLGQKIDNIKAENKYEIDLDKVFIKSILDDTYKLSTSQTEEVIFINQCDIVKYFEEKRLEDLANDSGKSQEYSDAKVAFSNHKQELQAIMQSLESSYLNNYNISESKRFVLHQKTISDLLNQKFIIKFDSVRLIEEKDLSTTLQNLKDDLEIIIAKISEIKKNKVLSLNKSDSKIVDDFEKLMMSKLTIVNSNISNNEKRNSFINKIEQIVIDQNDQLDHESKQKNISLQNLNTLKTDITYKFITRKELKDECITIENFDYSFNQSIVLNDEVQLVLEVKMNNNLKSIILDGINNSNCDKTLYSNLIALLRDNYSIKHYGGNSPENLKRKNANLLSEVFQLIDTPEDYLKYKDGSISKNNSPGYNSEKYLDIILNNSKVKLILIDQPEDNLGSKFISENLVSIIRTLKINKQIFLVTHNPSIVVYGDAECIVIAQNDNNVISYKQVVLEDTASQIEICRHLDGGEYIFNNRARKYNIKRILKQEEKHGTN